MFRWRLLIDVAAPALIMCWAAIYMYNAAAGDTGFGALSALERDVSLKAEEIDDLRARRQSLEQRADQLSSRSLDADFAEERIRAILGYAREGDVVISREELDALIEAQTAP
ncbi:MAG: septum formation initiator family protein [Pseudomonadota bacterium]